MSYYTHCSECGTPLTEDEVAYAESGSLVSEKLEFCEYCSQSKGMLFDLNDFESPEDFWNRYDEE